MLISVDARQHYSDDSKEIASPFHTRFLRARPRRHAAFFNAQISDMLPLVGQSYRHAQNSRTLHGSNDRSRSLA